MAPAGAGARRSHETSPGKITDVVTIGADLRAYLMQAEKSKAIPNTATRSVSQFSVVRSALYVVAEPKPGLHIVYNNDNSQTAQVFGMWQAQEGLPFYVRAGRFFVPYGIQWDDADNTAYIHTNPFAPTAVGFNMAPTQSDSGVEFGLAPKKDYFVNLSITNGQGGGGGDADSGKAFTGRAGFIASNFMVGGTGYKNTHRTNLFAPGVDQTRYGPIAWFKVNRAVLMYEGGFGHDKPDGGAKTEMASHAVEINAEPVQGWLGKVRLDIIDPDTKVSKNDRSRWTVSVERMFENVAVEAQYRIVEETPKVKNNAILLSTHLWF